MTATFWRVKRSQGQVTESSGYGLFLQPTPTLGPSRQPEKSGAGAGQFVAAVGAAGSGLAVGQSPGHCSIPVQRSRVPSSRSAPPGAPRLPAGGGAPRKTKLVSAPCRDMAAAEGLEGLLGDVDLSCSCCLQHFTDPVRLSGCGHSFCRACITQYGKSKQRVSCPLCREGFDLKDLQPNRELAILVNLIPRWVKEQELETQDEPKPSGACNDWSSAERRPGQKEEKICDISKQLEITTETIQLLRKDLSKAKEHASQIKSQVTKDFCCMKEYVERQERNTLMFIEQEQKAAEENTEETIHQLCVDMNNLLDIKADMSNLPDRHRYKGSPSTVNKITLDEKLHVVKSAVEDLKRKLEILLLEKYTWQSLPVPPPVSNQETSVCSSSPEPAAQYPEPVISSQFSQWADDVTFDLTRIHERLAITAQNRKVMVSSNPTDYKPSPNRFCISQVMCSQSFSAGCHYWEVITKNSDGWAVGVAHEMIGKRDKLGRTEHSWCVEWLGAKKQLSAWHRDQETLLHKDKPMKVGVLLELQKKAVSFYSITDKEVLLHAFEVDTSNPLYPAFWLYNLERNGSLTLSSTNRR
ncbi:E3 ubiquitin-protein ligase RNF135 [Melanerpes formicivorus]|uniref:E3 ubiquitin-protein ligase RNF135 n=1 Tax=Melanerpes formicivorus TaxID=211600 RepID=UPI00358EB2A1